MSRRLPRDLHPVAWWVWAIGLVVTATLTTNPLLLALVIAVSCLVAFSCRGDGTWARVFGLYLWAALAVVVIRVVFRIVLGGPGEGGGGDVLFSLPEIPLPSWAAGIRLLGPVTRESLLFGLYDGLRLAAILVAVGAANALANPKRLLTSLPPALYEVGTALVIAITVVPQLADSARRVREAQQLRGGADGRIRGLRRLVVPVLEDAFERSLSLAAGMDARGYGRSAGLTRSGRRLTGTLMIVGLVGVCVGVYAGLDRTTPRVLGTPMLVLGCLLALAGLVTAGRRVTRTRYRPTRWHAAEIATALTGVLVGGAGWILQRDHPAVAHPGVAAAPTVTFGALVGVLLALLPLLVAPPAPTSLAAPREVTP